MSKTTYRKLALALDPRLRLIGPQWIGHYKTYAVVDSTGVEIGYTDGNEAHPSFAWARAYDALRRRGQNKPAVSI